MGNMDLAGTPTDQLPEVLNTGKTDTTLVFISLSAREAEGRDAEYIEWHSLDHRPEQFRLHGLRNALRLVSTPACRTARAAATDSFDAVDHVMTYMFTDASALPAFGALGAALHNGGRMPLRLPSLGYITADVTGKTAAAHAVAGADVIPWRPALGVYLIVEEGEVSPEELNAVPGVAGIWWFSGSVAPDPFTSDSRGRQFTYCFLDRDPVETAALLGERLRQRWATSAAKGLFAAPFYTIVPFDWARHLP